MKFFYNSIIVFALMLCSTVVNAQNPNGENEKVDVPEMAAKEADNLAKLFNLDEYQLFRVDSVLQANMAPMMEEMDKVKKSGASIQSSYQVVADKWLDETDRAFEKIFTQEQWTKYMKSAYGKEKKKRDKRMEARNPKAE
ncbi:MAG: hypothetical protein PHD07_06740 [Bacteroidales bacterium]|nr:hypothetical protein [Bacteroidales bacterium]MDD3201437.1 hypothetical protein [Bacteroidales bacterium]